MHRRSLLRAGAAAIALPVAGRVIAASEPYRPLGAVPVPGARETVVDDAHAYVATGDGFAVVDVTDPREPAVVARETALGADREGGPLRDVWDLKRSGDRLAVAGPAVPDRDALHGFALYDVVDPRSPERVGFRETHAAIHNCEFAGDRVYVPETDTVNEGLLIFDVTGDRIERVGGWSIVDHDPGFETVYHGLYQLHDLRVRGDRAFLAHWDAGVYVLDVADPAAPEYLAHLGGLATDALHQATTSDEEATIAAELLQPPGNAHAVDVSADGRLLAVGRESWDLEPDDDRGGASGIEVWDVADLADPALLATIPPPPAEDQTRGGPFTTAHNFDLVGDRLYSAWYHGGAMVHDLSDPARPERLTWWQRPADASFWTAQHPVDRDFFVASDRGVTPTHADARLVTFPDEPTSGSEPSTAPVSTATPTPAPTASPTPTRRPSPTRSAGPSTTPTSSPGFGGVGALAGLGLGAWWRWRRRGSR